MEMRKWTPAALIAAAFAASLFIAQHAASPTPGGFQRLLPPQFSVGADSIPSAVALFGIPALALIVWALLFEAPVSRLGLAAARRLFNAGEPRYDVFAPTYRLIVLWVVALVLSLHLAFVAQVLEWSIEPGTIVGVTFGIGLMLVGNAMPRLRPNAVAGIRTARTMNDPIAWTRVHRAFGASLLVAGIFIVVVSIIAPRYALVTALVLLVLSLAAGAVRGHKTESR
jgi:uncharacterized membrane protein